MRRRRKTTDEPEAEPVEPTREQYRRLLRDAETLTGERRREVERAEQDLRDAEGLAVEVALGHLEEDVAKAAVDDARERLQTAQDALRIHETTLEGIRERADARARQDAAELVQAAEGRLSAAKQAADDAWRRWQDLQREVERLDLEREDAVDEARDIAVEFATGPDREAARTAKRQQEEIISWHVKRRLQGFKTDAPRRLEQIIAERMGDAVVRDKQQTLQALEENIAAMQQAGYPPLPQQLKALDGLRREAKKFERVKA